MVSQPKIRKTGRTNQPTLMFIKTQKDPEKKGCSLQEQKFLLSIL